MTRKSHATYNTMVDAARLLCDEGGKEDDYGRAMTELIANAFVIDEETVSRDIWPVVVHWGMSLNFELYTDGGEDPTGAQVVNAVIAALPDFLENRQFMDEAEEVEEFSPKAKSTTARSMSHFNSEAYRQALLDRSNATVKS